MPQPPSSSFIHCRMTLLGNGECPRLIEIAWGESGNAHDATANRAGGADARAITLFARSCSRVTDVRRTALPDGGERRRRSDRR